MSPWRHREAEVNGVSLHYVEAGTGPLVLLLHGFPDFWYSWHYQIPVLAEAGFRVVAPDLRGYNTSSKPEGIGSYRIDTLVADVAELINELGEAEAHLVGHDWGGVIAWYAAMLHPHRISKLAVLNAPHPVAFARELRRSTQLLRSWYAGFFQLPLLPEIALRANGYALLRRVLPHEAYLEAWAQPGALTAMVNYYRAAARYARPAPRPIGAPTLLIWGERDRFLVPGLTDGLEPWVPQLHVERLQVGHWVQLRAPDRVNALLTEFLV